MAKKCPHELKKLQTQLTRINGKISEHKSLRDKENRNIDKLLSEKRELKEAIAKMSDGVIVTEHAMLRYFERILGYDLKKIETEIATKQVRDSVSAFGDGTYEVNGKFTVRVKDGRVATIV